MKPLIIEIPGDPVSKKYRLGKRGMYLDPKVRHYQRHVNMHSMIAMSNYRPKWETDGYYDVKIHIKYRKILGRRHPDLDNLCKSICDGMKGHVYDDDRQVESVKVTYDVYPIPQTIVVVTVESV